MSTTTERVAKGAALLDAHKPDWYKVINLDLLDQSDPKNCVIGQNYNDNYISGCNTLFGVHWYSSQASDHAFSHADGRNGGWATDTAEWKRVILQRRYLDEQPSYSVAPEVVITNDNIEAAKGILRGFTSQSPTYAGDLTDTGVLYTILDALGVLPLVKS